MVRPALLLCCAQSNPRTQDPTKHTVESTLVDALESERNATLAMGMKLECGGLIHATVRGWTGARPWTLEIELARGSVASAAASNQADCGAASPIGMVCCVAGQGDKGDWRRARVGVVVGAGGLRLPTVAQLGVEGQREGGRTRPTVAPRTPRGVLWCCGAGRLWHCAASWVRERATPACGAAGPEQTRTHAHAHARQAQYTTHTQRTQHTQDTQHTQRTPHTTHTRAQHTQHTHNTQHTTNYTQSPLLCTMPPPPPSSRSIPAFSGTTGGATRMLATMSGMPSAFIWRLLSRPTPPINSLGRGLSPIPFSGEAMRGLT